METTETRLADAIKELVSDKIIDAELINPLRCGRDDIRLR